MHLYGTQAISEDGHLTIGQVDTLELAKEYGDCASILSIAPGSVATGMGDRKFGDNIGVNENMITKHIAMPEEIASLAAFLSGNMGLYLNGETVIASADETL